MSGNKIVMSSFISVQHYIINRWKESVFNVQQGVCPVSAVIYLYTCFGGRWPNKREQCRTGNYCMLVKSDQVLWSNIAASWLRGTILETFTAIHSNTTALSQQFHSFFLLRTLQLLDWICLGANSSKMHNKVGS